MKRKLDVGKSGSNKAQKIIVDNNRRTDLIFKLFKLDPENEEQIKAMFEELEGLGILNAYLAYKVSECTSAINEFDSLKLAEIERLEPATIIRQEDWSLVSIILAEELIIQGVNINAIDNKGKSFIHFFYDFLLESGQGLDMFYDLINPGKEEISYPYVIDYSNLKIDIKFLDSLAQFKDWEMLSYIRSKAREKCADKYQIEGLINNEYRTELCLKIFDWNAEDHVQVKEVMKGCAITGVLEYLVDEYGYDLNEELKDFCEFLSCLVDTLLERGVNINSTDKYGVSFLHKYYDFQENHPNGGNGFFGNIMQYPLIIIDEVFFKKLLEEDEWDVLRGLLLDASLPRKFIVPISSASYDTISRAYNSFKDSYNEYKATAEIEAKWGDFLQQARSEMTVRTKYMLFNFSTAVNKKNFTWLPSEIKGQIWATYLKLPGLN